MMTVRVTCLSICILAFGTVLTAQENNPGNNAPGDVDRLDAAVRRMVSYLASLPGYHVDVAQQWKLEGPHQSEGRNNLRLDARHSGPFRLQVSAPEQAATTLTCVGDGKQITRQLQSENQLIHSIHEGGLDQLLSDGLTESSLRHSGLDLLCREHPERYVMVMASNIEYVGREDLPSGPADHFRMNWGSGDGHRCDLWIATGDQPLLVKTQTELPLVTRQEIEHQLQVTSDLKWQKVDRHPEDEFQLRVPQESVEVADLYGHLAAGGTSALVGQAAPAVASKTLDGQDWKLPADQRVVVLYFFASWAAPSHHEKEAMLEMLGQYESEGVTFHAISVGEDAEAVRAFINAKQYEHSILLDPERRVAAAYRVTSLPTVVLIDKNRKLHSVHVGNTPEVRAELQRDIARMLDGNQQRKSR
jgi:peroxiredoxin